MTYNAMDLLVPVDTLIKKQERLYDDMIWEQDNPDPVHLSTILRELGYLYELRDNGVAYEPVF